MNILFHENGFVLRFRYDPELVKLIKELPIYCRKWNPRGKCWKVQYPTPEDRELFENIIQELLPANLYAKVKEKLLQKFRHLQQHATDITDIHIPGLAGDLRPFQKTGVAFAQDKDSVLIADEMGLGKTVQAIGILALKNAFPAIVVCPASLKLNWAKEVGKWLPDKLIKVYGKLKTEYNPDSADIHIINYDIVSRNLNTLLALDVQALVLDESHYCKNGKAQRTKAVLKLAKGIQYKILLSGTPILNKPVELWMQLRIMGVEKQIANSYKHYIYRYCDAQEKPWGLDVSGASNLRELNSKLKATCMIRRKKAQVVSSASWPCLWWGLFFKKV